MEYESTILKRLIDTYGVVGNPRYISEIIKEFIVRGKECFPNLFTYQADWLAHIDEFGLNPTYTVSYTGQSIYAPNTLERPVKSAILKGQTLVNLFTSPIILKVNENITVFRFKPLQNVNSKRVTISLMLPIGYKYAVYYKPITTDIDTPILNYTDTPKSIFTFPEDVNDDYVYIWTNVDGVNKLTNIEPTIIEGDYTNIDIPYFEGMQSVKMPVLTTTGKNLLDISNFRKGGWNWDVGTPETDYLNVDRSVINGYMEVKPNTYYTLTQYGANNTLWFSTLEFDANFTKVGQTDQTGITKTFRTQANTKYLRVMFQYPLTDLPKYQHQLEVGTVATPYEPYKSNILTVNEPIELRGIGDVKDELNLLTGEYVQRIGEVVLDGSDDEIYTISTNASQTLYKLYRVGHVRVKTVHEGATDDLLCDKLPSKSHGIYNKDELGVHNKLETLYMNLPNELTGASISGLRAYLQSNPITIQYLLAEPNIKTVDLTILDQNGQNVKQLMSFNGGTHFNTTSQEGSLLPTLTVDVVTDLEETLNLCSTDGNTL